MELKTEYIDRFGHAMKSLVYNSHDLLYKYKITMEDIFYIAWLMNNMHQYPHRFIKIDDKKYYWVEYSKIVKEFLYPEFSENNVKRVIANKFQSLVNKNIFEYHLLQGHNPITQRRGTYTLYRFNDNIYKYKGE